MTYQKLRAILDFINTIHIFCSFVSQKIMEIKTVILFTCKSAKISEVQIDISKIEYMPLKQVLFILTHQDIRSLVYARCSSFWLVIICSPWSFFSVRKSIPPSFDSWDSVYPHTKFHSLNLLCVLFRLKKKNVENEQKGKFSYFSASLDNSLSKSVSNIITPAQ